MVRMTITETGTYDQCKVGWRPTIVWKPRKCELKSICPVFRKSFYLARLQSANQRQFSRPMRRSKRWTLNKMTYEKRGQILSSYNSHILRTILFISFLRGTQAFTIHGSAMNEPYDWVTLLSSTLVDGRSMPRCSVPIQTFPLAGRWQYINFTAISYYQKSAALQYLGFNWLSIYIFL